MNTYKEALTVLNGRESKKLENNTYLKKRSDNEIAVQLHQTDVVTYKGNGKIFLDSGGWRTVTTKDRINTYSPVGISQRKGVWYLTRYEGNGVHKELGLYHDGVTLNPDGSTDAKAETKTDRVKTANLKKKIKEYSKKYVDALMEGKVAEPSAGDCWYCVMQTEDKRTLGEATKNPDHLRLHMDESYFVPSLLIKAFERCGASIAMKQTAHAYMQNKLEYAFAKERTSFIFQQMETSLYKFIKKQWGIA